MTRILSSLSLVFVLGACGGSGASTTCPPGGTTLTYAGFGQSYLSRYCTSCHGSSSPSEGLSLSTQALVQAHAGAVASETSRGSMPPRGSAMPTATEAAQLAEWLACGAP
jgi:hypothetical protein